MNKVIAHIALNILLAIAAPVAGWSQGWERILSTKGGEELYDIVASPAPAGGYYAVGQYDIGDDIYLIKTYADGRMQWNRRFSFFNNVFCTGRALWIAADGSVYIAGHSDGFGLNKKDVVLLKTDAEGNLLWQKNYGTTNTEEAFDLIPTTDGGLLIGGTRTFNPGGNPDRDILLLKTDADGGLVWEKTFGTAQTDEQAFSLTALPDGGAAVVGSVKLQNGDFDVLVLRTDASGDEVWQKSYGVDVANNIFDAGSASVLTPDGQLAVAGTTNSVIGSAGLLLKIKLDNPDSLAFLKVGEHNTNYNGICATGDGSFLVCGRRELPPTYANSNLFVAKLDADGNEVWERDFGTGVIESGNQVLEANDGGAVVVGFHTPYVQAQSPSFAYMVKTDANGVVFTDQISGHVFHDFDNDCSKDALEPGQQDWLIKITKPGAADRYAVSDASGFYKTEVDTGTYKVQLFRPNAYWQPCQPDGYSVTLSNFYDTATVNQPIKAAFGCASMRVDVVTPALVRCAENTYTVSYCNEGTIPVVNARIEVALDPSFNLLGSSVPAVPVGTNTYSFDLGFVSNGQCGSFTLTAFLDCDVELGAARCVTAHAYPDTFCKVAFPNWDGSILQATGRCENNIVSFAVENIGLEPMKVKSDFIVIEDVVLLTHPAGSPLYDIPALDPNESMDIWQAPANGSTRRFIASQTPGYPGASRPTAAVEGCLADTMGMGSLGFFTAFPDDEAEPFKASDCQEVLDANPGTTKIGHPKGVGTEHWITDSTDLEYLIQFQNDGTDTVTSVEIRDTLSKWLDPTTVKAGAGSAPFDFEVYDGGIVLFRIPNTVLYPVGSASGAPVSGFVHFRVSQKPITPCDTLITNRAAIFLNDRDPITTNEVRRRVCNDITHFITVETTETQWPGASVAVQPNPFTDYADFNITGTQAKSYQFELFDTYGKRVLTSSYNHPDFRLHRYQLLPGVFFYRLSADGKPVASGKVVAQ